MNRATARVRLKAFGQVASEPILADPADVEMLLDMARRLDYTGVSPVKDVYAGGYRTWYANITLSVGELVVPPVLNGHFYLVTASDGAAGATVPAWKTDGTTVTQDGVTYDDQGTWSWVESYDPNFAIAQAWLLKAGRLADRYLFMSGGKMFSRHQFYDHCMEQYRRYLSKSGLKSIPLASEESILTSDFQRVN